MFGRDSYQKSFMFLAFVRTNYFFRVSVKYFRGIIKLTLLGWESIRNSNLSDVEIFKCGNRRVT